ncbi:MAG: M28 family peptidase [Acidobacteria bacterium]|nr:M28 family peptidase [Acidobacteriota bacterium]
MRRRLFLSALTAAGLHAESPAAKRWWSHVAYLADDQRQGRDTGSPGFLDAARYLSAEFERAGLRAAGSNGYFQPVRLVSNSLDESHSSAELVSGDRTGPLRLGEDVYFSLRGNLLPQLDAPLVFAGYGFAVPEHDYDELRGLDLKGKVAVYLTGGPNHLPGPLVSHNQSSEVRWARLKAAGAVGVAVIGNPRAADIPWERQKLSRLQPSMKLTGVESDGPGVHLIINPAFANNILPPDHPLSSLLDDANHNRPLPKFEIPAKLRVRQSLRTAPVESMNVIGMKRGASLPDEYLVVSAHLDHVGVNANLKGDQIFNGAMDNASGIATMIEMAARLKNKRLNRSVLFVAVTGEEKGLLGSKYFATSPTVPKSSIIANLNFDMFLPLFPLKRVILYGKDESTLGDTAGRVAGSMGITPMADPEPRRNTFIRSDQYSFIQQGIPALSFKLGYEPNSNEERIFKAWLRERYHSVTDDLAQPVDKEAAARFTKLMTAIVTSVANDAERPRWKDNSFFRRFAQ